MSKITIAPTPYPELNQVLAELVSRLWSILDRDFTGAYLQGSFAVGDFDEHSDVDFIVATGTELTPLQVEALQVLHDRVYQLESPWAQHLEGSYFPHETLRDPARCGEPLWYLDHGARSLIQADHCNTLLVRWVVREQGIPLAGPPPQSLVDPVSTEMLRAEIFDTLINWGEAILADPAPYNNRFYQSFIVLSFCRMLHDLGRGYPGSKRAGAGWAKANLDQAWADLIDGAWDGRPDPARKVKEPADPQVFARTLKFVEYSMEESRRFYPAPARPGVNPQPASFVSLSLPCLSYRSERMMHQNHPNQFTPRASRPDMPEYGLLGADQGRGLLPWQWAQERLENAHNYWVATTRPDGHPHATPVWGIWWEDVFYFSTGRLTRKARNLAQNPHCVVCTENASEAVIVEGTAELVGDTGIINILAPLYGRKYEGDYPLDSNVYAVRPAVVFGFIDDETEFSGSATRWHF